MAEPLSAAVEETLKRPEIHQEWEDAYRTPENNRYYDLALDTIADLLAAPNGATLLDAGCGICDYSLRLARRGFQVTAVDLSPAVIANAAAHIAGLPSPLPIDLRQENLLDLSFADATFDYVLCWGVLMHIPEADRAIAELCRVVKPGGGVIVSEGNLSSFESCLFRLLRRWHPSEREEIRRTDSGLEHWWSDGDDRLLTREFDPDWLIRTFAGHGLTLQCRRAGQLSELYVRLPHGLPQKFVHAANRFWFKRIRLPGPAFGNIFFFRRSGAELS